MVWEGTRHRWWGVSFVLAVAETVTRHSVCMHFPYFWYLNLSVPGAAIRPSLTACPSLTSPCCGRGSSGRDERMTVWHSWDGSFKRADSVVRCILCPSRCLQPLEFPWDHGNLEDGSPGLRQQSWKMGRAWVPKNHASPSMSFGLLLCNRRKKNMSHFKSLLFELT